MAESFGTWLRRERERRGITLKAISDQTKVSVPLLKGLESDDLSQWPSGIFRRGFVRAYATSIGLDAEDVMRRFEASEAAATAEAAPVETASTVAVTPVAVPAPDAREWPAPAATPAKRARLLGTAADLTVALVLGLGSAAAGSRLLWPVLLIAGYYAVGILLTGTSPMVALMSSDGGSHSAETDELAQTSAPRPQAERRHQRRNGPRGPRAHRNARQRVQ